MRLNRRFRTSLLLLSIAYICYGQEVTIRYDIYLQAVQEIARSTVFIKAPTGTIGSGMLIKIPYSDTSRYAKPFVVTAKHILFEDSVGVDVFRPREVQVSFNLKVGGLEDRRYEPALVFENADLMVLRLVQKKRPYDDYETVTYLISDIANPDSVLLGQYVYVAGFPLSIGVSSRRLTPVITSGIVAHADGGIFLIDVPVNKGNSGGGVFTVNRYGTLELLGVVSGYPPTREYVLEDLGLAVVKGKEKFTISQKYSGANSSLGLVNVIAPIRTYATWLLEKHGLRYVP